MTIRRLLLPRRVTWSKTCAVALVAASLAAGSSAFGQAYSTTFDGTPAYTNGGSLSGQNGWDTNDANRNNTTGASVGQSDYVGQVTGYLGSSTANFQGALGGLYHGTTTPTGTTASELPGAPIVYLFHSLSPGSATTYTFNTDFDISFPATGTTTGTPNTTRDSFGFNFQTSALTNLFSVNFTPDRSGNGNSANQMIIGYSVGGVQTTPTPSTANVVVYNSIYHLQLSVNVTAKTLSFVVTGSTNNFTLSDIPLSTIDPSSVQQLAATWTLTTTAANTIDGNGGYTQAGSNAIIFDNFAFAVPEPSTWAMLGIGAVAGGAVLRRRVRA